MDDTGDLVEPVCATLNLRLAFVAQARAAFIVARDPADKERRLFLPTKNNVGPEGTGIGFRIGQVETPTGLLAPSGEAERHEPLFGWMCEHFCSFLLSRLWGRIRGSSQW